MKKVLIVLKDVVLLSEIKRWYSRLNKENESVYLFFAKDTPKALEIIQKEPIDLLITELNLPKTDGIELIAELAKQDSSLQLAIFLSINEITLKSCQLLRTFSSVYFLHYPHSLKEFIVTYNTLNVVLHQALKIADINIADFFKLIEFQKKSCLITVENLLTTQKALVYFENGVLYDAVHGILKWEAAVLDIMTWKKTLVAFKPVNKQFRRKIFTGLDDLITQLEQTENKDDLDFLIENVLAEAEARIKLESHKNSNNPKVTIEEPIITAPVTESAEKIQLETENNKTVPEDIIEIGNVAEVSSPIVIENIEPVDNSTQVITKHFELLNLNEILQPLLNMDGYLVSSLFDINGNMLAEHNMTAEKIELPIKTIAVLIKTLSSATNDINLGKSNFMQLNCNNGIFQAVWELESQFIITVLLDINSKDTNLAKINLLKVCEKVKTQLYQ